MSTSLSISNRHRIDESFLAGKRPLFSSGERTISAFIQEKKAFVGFVIQICGSSSLPPPPAFVYSRYRTSVALPLPYLPFLRLSMALLLLAPTHLFSSPHTEQLMPVHDSDRRVRRRCVMPEQSHARQYCKSSLCKYAAVPVTGRVAY